MDPCVGRIERYTVQGESPLAVGSLRSFPLSAYETVRGLASYLMYVRTHPPNSFEWIGSRINRCRSTTQAREAAGRPCCESCENLDRYT